MTRRVPPLLVTSNTIFDVARRGKTLLVTSNIKPQVPLPRSKCETEGVFFCQHTLHPSLARKARRRRCCFCRHTLHPSLARNARRRGVSSVDTPPPSLEAPLLETAHHHHSPARNERQTAITPTTNTLLHGRNPRIEHLCSILGFRLLLVH